MTKGNQFTRALALSTALSVAALGVTTTAAEASFDPGKSQGKSQGADKSQGKSQGQAKGHEKKAPKPSSDKGGSSSNNGNGHGQGGKSPAGNDHAHNGGGASTGGSGSDHGSADQGPTGNDSKAKGPKDKGGDNTGGNNGTVKIDGWTLDHGTGNGAPNRNEPHVDCTFDVEWYNFDASVTSTVTFEMHAPTSDVELGTYVTSVALDDDDASGANAAGLDAVQPYELQFTGEPHPKHGYHVKLTINTPITNGNSDVKHKVFWVEPCEDVTTPPPGGEEEPPPGGEEEPPPGGEEEPPEVPEVRGDQGNDLETEIEVLGEQGVDADIQGEQALPNAVDAGLEQSDVVSPTSSLPLMLTLYGALLAGLALLIRRRTS